MRIVLLSFLLLIALTASAMADATYSYTGNPFTTTASPYSSGNFVTVSFTTLAPLGANLTDAVFTPVQFTFSDQLFIMDNTGFSLSTHFQVSTDANGAFTNWFMWVFDGGNNYIETINLPGITSDYARHGSQTSTGTVSNAPGRWGDNSLGTSTVPEPSGLLLLGTGTAALAGLIRRRIAR